VKGADRWGPAVSERGKKKKRVRELGCRGWLACWPVVLVGSTTDFRDCRPMKKVKALEIYLIKGLSLSLNLDTFQIQTSHK
jgi:hypothetical protein